MAINRRMAARGVPVPGWKVEAPRLPVHTLERNHLLARLERSLGKKNSSGNVFLVSAPAGYGKTTLLVQWAERASIPVVWYHLDAGDGDPAALISGIVHAIRGRHAHSDWTVEGLLGRMRDGALSPGDVRRATSVLAGDVQRNVKRPLALVLTGLAEVSAHGDAQTVLNGLLARSPDHLRVVLETREAPRLRVSPLLTQRRLDGMGVDDLRLRDDEFTALLELIGVRAAPERVEKLREHCAGWITGVLLGTGALLPNCLSFDAAADFDRERIFDYLASEVIEMLPETLREFAMEAAVPGYMTGPLCANLLELADAGDHLVALEQHAGFVTRTGRWPDTPAYRFQPLLRQALLDRLEARPGGRERRRALHERAGEMFEMTGDFEEAAQQYASAGRFERLAALIQAKRGTLLRAGRGATLARWLDLLPAAVRDARPELHVLLADLYRHTGRAVEAREAAMRACEALLPQADAHPALAARALAARASACFLLGEYEAARSDCAAALRHAPVDDDELHIDVTFVQAAVENALAGPAAADASLASIEERCARQRNLWALARLHYLRSKVHTAAGAYAKAEAAASSALLYAQEANSEVDAINSRLNLGAIAIRTNRPAVAREHFEVASVHADAAGYALGQAYALTNLADLERSTDAFERAAATYERALHAAESAGDAYLLARATSGYGYTLVLLGRTQEAIEALTSELARQRVRGGDADCAALATSLGFAYLRNDQVAQAIEILGEATIRADARDAAVERALAYLHLAAARHLAGQRASARAALRVALAAIPGADSRTAILFELRQLPELRSLLEELDHPRARDLRTHLNESQTSASTGASAAVCAQSTDAPVRVFALGEARVFVGAEPVTHWRMPHARELLFFLLDQREPVRRDVVLDRLWPDKDPESSDNAFRQARFRLKHALGRECLAQQGGRWRLTIDCWVDVREFERLADEGERLADEGQLAAALSTLSQALTYWSGDYLDDLYSEWAILRRDELRRRYLTCLDRVAELAWRLERFDLAAQYFHQTLEIEPHRENAHRGLMRYFLRKGEPAEAIRQFARCANVLKQEMAISPSSETIQLYRDIRAGLERASAHISR